MLCLEIKLTKDKGKGKILKTKQKLLHHTLKPANPNICHHNKTNNTQTAKGAQWEGS